LLSSSWRHHPCHDGVVTVDAQACLQSKHLCRHCNNTVAIAMMVLLPLSNWCCCPHHDGVVTIIDAQVSLPLSQWHHPPHCTGTIANIAWALLPLLRWHCCPYCADLFALMSHGHHHRCCTGVVPPLVWHVCAIALVLSPLSCPWCAGISTPVMQISLPSLCLHYAVDLKVSLSLLSWHELSRGGRGRPRRRQWQHQHNKGNDTSTTRAATSAQ
jgi:hypothetical protein